jgi:beta-glucosidase-like glycosyl hydrolase
MLVNHILHTVLLSFFALNPSTSAFPSNGQQSNSSKNAFIEDLVSRMTVPDMLLQLYLMFGDDVIGPKSHNELYDHALRSTPGSPIGVIHDWYTLNTSQFNELQRLNLEKSHLKIPFMHTGECLHGVGSFQQSMFPQALGMSASFDTDLVHRVGAAIGTEARSIGIHACFSPVLDICQDPRWGRCQGIHFNVMKRVVVRI